MWGYETSVALSFTFSLIQWHGHINIYRTVPRPRISNSLSSLQFFLTMTCSLYWENTSLPEFPNGYYSSWSTVMKESHSRSQMWGNNSPSTSLPTLGTMLMSIMPTPHGKGVEVGDCRDCLRTVCVTQRSPKQKSNKLGWRSGSISKVLEAQHENLSSIPNTSINSAVEQPACHNHCAAWGSQILVSQPSQSVSSRFNMRPYLKKWSG